MNRNRLPGRCTRDREPPDAPISEAMTDEQQAEAVTIAGVMSPAPRDIWQSLADADEHALPFQTPAWTDALCASGDWMDASRLYTFSDGRQAVLPLVRRRRRAVDVAATEASMPPQWGSGGAVCAASLSEADLRAVLEDLRAAPALRVLLRPSPLRAAMWAAAMPRGTTTVPHVAHILDLDGGFALVAGQRFHRSTRRYIRIAERSGLTVESATGAALVPQYHELYLRWVERRARERHVPRGIAHHRAEPRRRLELIAAHMGPSCRIWHARHDGRPAAALMLVVHGAHAVYLRGCSDLALTRRTKANDLLQRLAIEEACAAGCRYYHMGESGGVASLMSFKERFGARPFSFRELRLERLPVTSLEACVGRTMAAVEARLLAAGARR